MPVIEKNSPGHTNGESTGESIKDIQPAKVKQGEPLLPQPPANQVHYVDTDACYMNDSNLVKTTQDDLCLDFPIPFLCILTSFHGSLIDFQDFIDNFSSLWLLNIHEPACQHRSSGKV